MSDRTIALVGHCGPDVFMLKTAMQRIAPTSPITVVNDTQSLDAHVEDGAILLVNRVLDGAFANDDGIELIRRVTAGDDAARAILISNLPNAQDEAVSAGASPGFGKSQLYDAETAERLRALL